MVVLSCDHLWRGIARATTRRLQCLTWFIRIGEAEIDDFDVIIVIHEEVFRLQITMTDAKLMQVLDSGDQLQKKLGRLLLPDTFSVDNVFEKFTATRILHD